MNEKLGLLAAVIEIEGIAVATESGVHFHPSQSKSGNSSNIHGVLVRTHSRCSLLPHNTRLREKTRSSNRANRSTKMSIPHLWVILEVGSAHDFLLLCSSKFKLLLVMSHSSIVDANPFAADDPFQVKFLNLFPSKKFSRLLKCNPSMLPMTIMPTQPIVSHSFTTFITHMLPFLEFDSW